MTWKCFPHYWPLCERNPPVTSGFPPQRARSSSFHFFCQLKKLFKKYLNCHWFQTLWHSCDITVMIKKTTANCSNHVDITVSDRVSWYRLNNSLLTMFGLNGNIIRGILPHCLQMLGWLFLHKLHLPCKFKVNNDISNIMVYESESNMTEREPQSSPLNIFTHTCVQVIYSLLTMPFSLFLKKTRWTLYNAIT